VLDSAIRPYIDPPLHAGGAALAGMGVRPEWVTLAGFAAGLSAAAAIGLQEYGAALALWIANRLADGLDGHVARATAPSDRGGYLDIVCDFLVYAALPCGFAVADPENALPAAFLLLSFVGTGTTFLAFAALAAKRGLANRREPNKSIYYLGGLTEGTETVIFFLLVCLWPGSFAPMAWIFASMCAVTAVARGFAGWRLLKD
jgi:phosphatidylglycerophosphate synthase